MRTVTPGESGAELRVRVHRHLRLYPMLTAYEIARALGAGQAVVRRQLRLLEGDGEARKVEGVRSDGEPSRDHRPAVRWTAT